MYAVIVSGGKQHRVEEGETLKLEKLNIEVGASVDFDYSTKEVGHVSSFHARGGSPNGGNR